jgi:hypothetical protein
MALITVLLWPMAAQAATCTMQSQMTPANRTLYEQAARTLGMDMQAANISAVQADTIPPVAAQFGGLANTIQQVAPEIKQATLTVDSLYNLNATDLSSPQQAEFFCSVTGSTRVITVTIPQLPPGNYLLAVLHATGVPKPQQLSLILQNDPANSPNWKLAGLFVRPLAVAGHDGLWFWTHGRSYAATKQDVVAYFYYQMAQFLLDPVDFFASPNLEKLQKEMQAIKPADLPGEKPMVMNVNGLNLQITGMRTQDFGGQLDLVIEYKAQGAFDPVSLRSQILALDKAMLARNPGMSTAFHGLWVYAYNANGQPFAIELPMNQIQ